MESHSPNSIAALLIVIPLIFSVTNSGCEARPAAASTNTEFIRTSCSATTYPTLCYSSLSSHAALIQENHKILANTALSVSLDTTRSTSAAVLKLSHTSGVTPREAGAMHDCLEVLSDSVEQLKNSMEEMNQINASNFGMTMSDVQTWVSAALTDEDTCMDSFAGNAVDVGVKAAVRGRIVNVAHMTSNALSLINTYASLHDPPPPPHLQRRHPPPPPPPSPTAAI